MELELLADRELERGSVQLD